MQNTETLRLLDAARAAHGNCTDYRICRLLNAMPALTSRWRRGGHMSDDYAVKVAELAGLDPVEAVLRVMSEREGGVTGDLLRKALARMSKAASILLAALFGLMMLWTPQPAVAAPISPAAAIAVSAGAGRVLYILLNWLRGLEETGASVRRLTA